MPAAAVEAVFKSINTAYRYQPEAPGRDDWRTPAEFAAAGGGDCEDFAIAYWHALRNHNGHARVAFCWRSDRQAHTVCLYYQPDDADPLVLDVVVDAVCRLSERPDLVVLYELDADGIYGRPRAPAKPWRPYWIGPATQVAPWAGVLERMRLQERSQDQTRQR